MNIEELSALEIGAQIAAGELTSVEVTQHYLSRIQACDAGIGAFTEVAPHALDEAAEVDRLIQSGDAASPLAGVPIAVKDVLCTQDMKTTCGSRYLQDFTAPYTATAVEKVRRAGMVVLGKTNMDEFAMGGSTETSAHGPTRNPWDKTRTPGGSSGGSAAAVSAGMAPLSLGTDTGGSVRQPAAFCGVCGLKPTYGRVSRYGLVAYASSLDQVGPLGHRVEDMAACLQAIAGHDSMDSTSLDVDVPDYSAQLDADIAGMKVGVIREHLDNPALSPEVRASVENAQSILQDLGASIVEVHLPHTQYSVPSYYVVAPCEASGNLSRYDGVHYGMRELSNDAESPLHGMIAKSRSQGFGPEVQRRIMLGTFALSAGYYDAYYKKALQVRRLISEDYQSAFQQVELLLGPTTPTTAFGLGEKLNDPVQMYLCDLFTVGANLAGIPAVSLPAQWSSEGLPIGVQLHAPALGEARLLNAAYKLQSAGLFEPRIAPSAP